jgi:hypothetical protein
MRLLSFAVHEWVISQEKPRHYIDIACRANRKSTMRRPFLSFCEDALLELSRPGTPDDAIYKTARRWQRFWNSQATLQVTDEWIHGLGAELLFLRDLLLTYGSGALRAWTGATGHDHDFQANGVGIEVKATLTQPPILKVNNLNQLDPAFFEALYVVVYSISAVSRGHRLPALVQEIETLLGEETDLCDVFWQKLSSAGYGRHLEDRYNETGFAVDRQTVYHVDERFPKLTTKNLSGPLDARINSVRYTVRLSGLQGMSLSATSFSRAIKRLTGSPPH